MPFESDSTGSALAGPSNQIPLNQEMLEAVLRDYLPPNQIEMAVKLIVQCGGKLPQGVRGLPPGLAEAMQRERIVVGMLLAAAELGYRETNVQDVIKRAGVSRVVFYEHFVNKEDCFLAAFDTGAKRLRKKVEAAAQRGGDSWRDRLHLGLEALIQFMLAEPATAKTLIVEARGASIEALTRRAQLIEGFAECLDAGARELLSPDRECSPLIAAGVVGGIEALLYARLNQGEFDHLEELLPSLTSFVVVSYEA